MKKLSKYVEKEILEIVGKDKEMAFPLFLFSGLKDKLGRNITFGDILIDDFNNLLTPVIEVEKGEHILYFKPLKHLKSKLHIGCKSTYSETLIVVDNIFEKFNIVN